MFTGGLIQFKNRKVSLLEGISYIFSVYLLHNTTKNQ